MKKKLYQVLASLAEAYHLCADWDNDWAQRHEQNLEWLVRRYLPHGAGIEFVEMDPDLSNANKLVFYMTFHQMHNGYYAGYARYRILVVPTLTTQIEVRAQGPAYDGLRDYIEEAVFDSLMVEAAFDEESEKKSA